MKNGYSREQQHQAGEADDVLIDELTGDINRKCDWVKQLDP